MKEALQKDLSNGERYVRANSGNTRVHPAHTHEKPSMTFQPTNISQFDIPSIYRIQTISNLSP